MGESLVEQTIKVHNIYSFNLNYDINIRIDSIEQNKNKITSYITNKTVIKW